MRQVVFLLVLGGVGLAVAAAAPAERAALKVECKLAGIHYLGTTSQAQKVCFTLSPDRKALREYGFGGRFKCADGVRRVGTTHIEPGIEDIEVGPAFLLGPGHGNRSAVTRVARDGTFSDTPLALPDTFSGKLEGTQRAGGHLRQHLSRGSGLGVVCDTGSVRWTARPAPR